jgi:hypothetical protein
VLGARHEAVENAVARTSPLCPAGQLATLLVGVADRRVNGLETLEREVVGDVETEALRFEGHRVDAIAPKRRPRASAAGVKTSLPGFSSAARVEGRWQDHGWTRSAAAYVMMSREC